MARTNVLVGLFIAAVALATVHAGGGVGGMYGEMGTVMRTIDAFEEFWVLDLAVQEATEFRTTDRNPWIKLCAGLQETQDKLPAIFAPAGAESFAELSQNCAARKERWDQMRERAMRGGRSFAEAISSDPVIFGKFNPNGAGDWSPSYRLGGDAREPNIPMPQAKGALEAERADLQTKLSEMENCANKLRQQDMGDKAGMDVNSLRRAVSDCTNKRYTITALMGPRAGMSFWDSSMLTADGRRQLKAKYPDGEITKTVERLEQIELELVNASHHAAVVEEATTSPSTAGFRSKAMGAINALRRLVSREGRNASDVIESSEETLERLDQEAKSSEGKKLFLGKLLATEERNFMERTRLGYRLVIDGGFGGKFKNW